MNHLISLRTLNNKLLRILQQKPARTHTVELYRTYHTLPVQILHNYQILKFMHRSRGIPPEFSAHFEENKIIHLHNTRRKDDFHTYIVEYEIGKVY